MEEIRSTTCTTTSPDPTVGEREERQAAFHRALTDQTPKASLPPSIPPAAPTTDRRPRVTINQTRESGRIFRTMEDGRIVVAYDSGGHGTWHRDELTRID